MKWIIGILILLAFCAYGMMYMCYCFKQKQRSAGIGMILAMLAALGMMVLYLGI